MPVERREQVTRVEAVRVNGQPEELAGFGGRRQPSLGGTSRMNREIHVRLRESLKVRFLWATRPATRSNAKAIKRALAYLIKNKPFLKKYEDIEDFFFKAFEEDVDLANAVEFHLMALRRTLLSELWSRQIFLSANAIDQLLYLVLRHDKENPLETFVNAVFENGLHRPGFVLSVITRVDGPMFT